MTDRRLVLKQESLRQARLFPQVYRAFEQYAEGPDGAGSLLELQRTRLRALLGHALRAVPAVRALDLDVDPDSDPFETLGRFPVTTRENLRDEFLDRVADDLDPEDCSWRISSGTSGVPLKIIEDAAHLIHWRALAMRRYHDYGLPLDRKALRPFRWGPSEWLEYTALTTGFIRYAEFPYLDDLTADERQAVATRCREFRPDLLFCTPSCAMDLRELLSRHPGSRCDIKAIVTYGEQLNPYVRHDLTDFFQAPLFDQYGLTEVGTVAGECAEGRYHIDSERIWVEILDGSGQPAPEGTEGTIVLTNLLNNAFPVIRYWTDDRGALDTARCPCGRPQKVLRLTHGRTNTGRIVFADGTSTEARRVVWTVDSFPVAKMQVVQASTTEVQILIKPLPSFDRRDVDNISSKLRGELGNRMLIDVKLVDDVAFSRGKGGKIAPFVPLQTRNEKGGVP